MVSDIFEKIIKILFWGPLGNCLYPVVSIHQHFWFVHKNVYIVFGITTSVSTSVIRKLISEILHIYIFIYKSKFSSGIVRSLYLKNNFKNIFFTEILKRYTFTYVCFVIANKF